jgi:CheY-like chemotaxis protein
VLLSSRSAFERYPGTPIIVLTDVVDPPSRLDLASHATSLLGTRARPAEVLDETRRQIHIARHQEQMAVRGEGAARVVADLVERGLEAWSTDDDAELLARLDAGRATGVMLMPSPDNARLVRLLRSQPTTRRCVIVEVLPTSAQPVSKFGVDLILGSSAGIDFKVTELRALLKLRADVEADLAMASRAGGVPWASAKFLAERLLLGIHRAESVASLCVVRFDDSDPMNEIDAVQEQLMREFRTDDIVTRSDDRETILVLGGVDRQVSRARLEGVAKRLTSVAIRVGIAEFPYDAQSLGDLVTEARAIVVRSMSEDGPRVVTADWRPGGLVSHDVVVADSDPAVATVVGEALQRCGLSVAHVSDGQLLLERLADPDIRLPKLLLLEFDLLSVDGLTVLRRLHRQAALRRFDVVMLSARTREADIRQAYDLGATEVIQKPFSPGILVRRILRIMDVDT